MAPQVINNLLSVEALLREINKLDLRIEANKEQIKQDRADKIKLNKVIALVEQMYPENTPANVTRIQLKKCPECGERFPSRTLGVHVRMKHQGGADQARKAMTKKRVAK